MPFQDHDPVELLVTDPSLSQALYEGIPAARLVSRIRLARDTVQEHAFEVAQEAVLPLDAREGVLRAVLRHHRMALDEGPLEASDWALFCLVFTVALSGEHDASLAELSQRPVPDEGPVVQIARAHEPRLFGSGREPLFREIASRLAAKGRIGPMPWGRLSEMAVALSGKALARTMFVPDDALFPSVKSAQGDVRMMALGRSMLDLVLKMDPRVLASSLSRTDSRDHELDRLVADLSKLLTEKGLLLVARPPVDPRTSQHSARPRALSFTGEAWDEVSLEKIAQALESGLEIRNTVEAAVLEGGDPALDAIGKEMLRIEEHPAASQRFAEIVAHGARPRDVIRLVTYFAVAPDVDAAARALSECSSPDLVRVLAEWLEAMLPAGEPVREPFTDTSAAARVATYLRALAPYPHLLEGTFALRKRAPHLFP